MNSSVLSLLYGPSLTSVHDYWKNYSFDYINVVEEVLSLLFNPLSRFVCHSFPYRKQASFNLIATVPVINPLYRYGLYNREVESLQRSHSNWQSQVHNLRD